LTTRTEQARAYARELARELTRLLPEKVTDTMTKSRRAGKVLVDWSQNNPAKTTVAPYSLRARPNATVSTPITWQEVECCRTETQLRFDHRDVLRRIEQLGDLMAPLQTPGNKLPA
jgi:bifunctional non-homologous end joining protein LigD